MVWHFGDKLRYVRTHHQLSQTRLAEEIGIVSQAHVSNLEAGRFLPSLDVVLAAGQYFVVSLSYLLDEHVAPEHLGRYTHSQPYLFNRQVVGTQLARYRKQAGMTQVQLAHQVGLTSNAFLSALENGTRQPSPDLLFRLAAALHIAPERLVTTDDE